MRSATRTAAALLAVLGVGCGSDSPTAPSDGPVTVNFQIQVSRPTGASQLSNVEIRPPMQALETLVRIDATVSGDGSMTVTIECTVFPTGLSPIPIPNLGLDNQVVTELIPLSLQSVVPVTIVQDQLPNLGGSVQCNATGSTSAGDSVNLSSQDIFTANDFRNLQELCVPDAQTMCLFDDRFKVIVDWRDNNNQTGQGQVSPGQRFDDGGWYFFSDPNAFDVFFQMTNECSFNNHFWVFFAANTNVEYTLKVTDTQNGLSREYFNPLGNAAPAVTDTTAFATCP